MIVFLGIVAEVQLLLYIGVNTKEPENLGLLRP